MQWRKAPQGVKEAFAAALPDDPAVEKKQMFGYPAAFVNANMFAGVHQEDIVVRLPAERRAVLQSETGARQFEPMPGRPMREYIVVPDAARANPEELARWLGEAFRYAAKLPAKERKPRRKKA
jgi:TfoX/Sxy family transcriptional regulator of competence genes